MFLKYKECVKSCTVNKYFSDSLFSKTGQIISLSLEDFFLSTICLILTTVKPYYTADLLRLQEINLMANGHIYIKRVKWTSGYTAHRVFHV